MNLIYFLSIFILIVVVLTAKDLVLPPNNKKNGTYWITLLLTTLIIVCCIYLLQTFVVENFHFEVSPPRKLGMQEHVLPLIKPGEDPGYGTQSVDYPVQGSGITCSKAYIGHEGNLEMNIGEWKRGSGDGIPARPDIYLNGNKTKVPFAANCQSCEVNRGAFEIENPDKPCPSPYFENTDKKIVKENYEQDKLKSLQIVLYSRDGCPFCVKAKEILGDHISKITVKNEAPPEGVNGVPHFVSKLTNKSHTGCPTSIDMLVSKLDGDQKKSPEEGEKITMYYNDRCGFCKKAKKILANVMDQIELRNTKDHPLPDGVNGVPHFEYKGKSHTGCPSTSDELLTKLEIVQENYEGEKIVMYYNDICSFCKKAKEILANVMDQIELRNTKDHSLPEGVNGVPHFEYKGKSHTGCPSTADELFTKLEIVQENYEPTPYNSQYFDYNNYIAPYEKGVVDTLSCYSGGCPLKNKSGKVGVPFV